MKAGGAAIRVISRPQGSLVVEHFRSYAAQVLGVERPPDAYAAVALWFDPKRPGTPSYNATYCTTIDAIPSPVLVRMAGDYLVAEHAAHTGACRAIETMGGLVDDWTPDDAG